MRSKGGTERSLRLFEQVLRYRQASGATLETANTMNHMAQCYRSIGALGKAIGLLKEVRMSFRVLVIKIYSNALPGTGDPGTGAWLGESSGGLDTE